MDYTDQVLAAGLPLVGSAIDGMASFSRELTTAEWYLYWTIADPVAAREYMARINASEIPSWSAWDKTTANAWVETNIRIPLTNGRANLPATLTLATALAAFVVLLNILDQMLILQWATVRMVLALRDKTWPDLADK